jgi:peptidyl-prolyl cis-trans isomerase D
MKGDGQKGFLESIRERVQGWALWLFLLVVAAPFVFFGMGRYLQSTRDSNVVARVDGTAIPTDTFQRRFQYAFAQVRQMLTEGGQRQLPNEAGFERAYKLDLLHSMVQERLLARAAIHMGLGVPDAVLARTIRNVAVFQDHGEFSQSRYQAALAAVGEHTSSFEDDLRQQMLAAFVQQAITFGVVVTDQDVNAWIRQRDEQRLTAATTFSWQKVLAQVSVNDQEIQDYFKAHMEDFREPPRIQLEALVITPQSAGVKPPSEEELQRYYREHHQEFMVPAQRLVRHILLRGGDIQKPLQQIRDQLRTGKSFAMVAKAYSEDAGTKELGGELGWIQQGMLPPELEKVVFALPLHTLSEPVKGPEGWHVFWVEASRGGTEQPFAEVKDRIAKAMTAQRTQEAMQAAREQLTEWVYAHGGDLEPLAKRYGGAIQRSPWLTPTDPAGKGLWHDPAIRQVAFGQTPLAADSLSEPVVLADGTLAVIRVAAREPARAKALQEIRGEVIEALKKEKAQKLTIQQAQTLMDQLTQKSTAQSAAEAMTAHWLSRSGSQGVPDPIQKAAFGLGPPAQGQRAVTMTLLPSGDVAVVWVQQVKPGNPVGLNAKERSEVADTLRGQKSEQMLNAYLAHLAQTMRVELYTDRL